MSERTLYTWFAESVAAHPDAPSLDVGDDLLTYTELSRLVDSLAAHILATSHGRVPARVGLLAARSVLTYAGYLAVLRLGSTVVPLNPSFPPGRNAAITRTGKLNLMLVEQPSDTELPVPIVHLDPSLLAELPTSVAPTLPSAPGISTDIAYVLFTSGSTGVPKGVPIQHRNVTAYLEHIIPRYGLGPGSRLSQTFDLNVDPSAFDMFAAWGSGATLVVHGLAPGSMPHLRWSLFAGGALTQQQARTWQAAAAQSTIENIYGPTELTVTCTEYRLPAAVAQWPSTSNGTIPIGQVYPHLEHVIVDESGLLAADGELCIRGPQRFPGYVDPAENVNRFFEQLGSRFVRYAGTAPLDENHWYRTGDRVRREGGEIVHLGRLDNQLKIRGYRVELGEIEAVLRRQLGVREAVVVPVNATDGEVDLIAVYTGLEHPDESLLSALRSDLPPYMIPRRLVWREELPLNLNGKVDRNRLVELMELVVS